MIEVPYTTKFGPAQIFFYSATSVRLSSAQRDGLGLTINRVAYDVDFELSQKKDGTWDLGHYDESNPPIWHRRWVNAKRTDSIDSAAGRDPSRAARLLLEAMVPGVVIFVVGHTDILQRAELEYLYAEVDRRVGKVKRLADEIDVLRQESLVFEQKAATLRSRLIAEGTLVLNPTVLVAV